MNLSACWFEPSRVYKVRMDYQLPEPMHVGNPQNAYREAFDKGQVTVADFPGNLIPAGSTFRRESYCDCNLVADSATEVVTLPDGCTLTELIYRCTAHDNLYWIVRGQPVVVYRQTVPSESFEVIKTVQSCADGCVRVLPGEKPPPKPTPGYETKSSSGCAGPIAARCPPCAKTHSVPPTFEPPPELPTSIGLVSLSDTPHVKTLEETVWLATVPRTRVAECLEYVTYKLARRTLTVYPPTALAPSGRVDVGPAQIIKPEVPRTVPFVIPDCPPTVQSESSSVGGDSR